MPPRAAPSVVIVTHRGGPLLRGCLDALAAQTLAPTAVIVVVSALGPLRVEAPPELAVEVLYLGENPGFAGAANAGLRRAPPGAALILNDDTAPAPGFLAALAAAATRPGIYQPAILLMADPSRLDNLGHHLWPDGFNVANGRGRPAAALGAEEAELGAFSGAAALFTAEVRETVGLFDQDFEAFGEDLDLSLRALRRGFRVVAVPEARIQHALGASYGRVSPRKVFLVERNRVRAAARSLPWSALVGMPAWSGARLALMGAVAAAGRGAGAGAGLKGVAAALAGGAAGLVHLPDALRKRAQDQPTWTVGDREVWAHLWRHRARARDWLG